ncbi:MAG: hypothetical protein ACKVS5_01245 [Parvularculaceae bacterium]
MRRNDPLSLWLESAAAMNAAGVTIAMRLMRMQAAMLAGDLTGGREAQRMVPEKILAAQQGYFKMAGAFASIMMAPPASSAALQRRTTAAIAAGVRPGFAKARANARRLTR